MVLRDMETAAFLQASCWETKGRLCDEHHRASVEKERADLEQFLAPSLEADVRVMVAMVALNRAEGRLR